SMTVRCTDDDGMMMGMRALCSVMERSYEWAMLVLQRWELPAPGRPGAVEDMRGTVSPGIPVVGPGVHYFGQGRVHKEVTAMATDSRHDTYSRRDVLEQAGRLAGAMALPGTV